MVDAQGTRTSLIDDLTAEDGSRGRSTEEQLLDLFKRNGVHVNRAEGDSYFWIDQSRLAAAVYPYVTDATRDHMRLVALEQREPFTEHEVITIPLDSLAARLTLVDEMIVRHDSTIIAPKLRDMRSGYIAGYLTGFANSSVFDDSGELRPDVRSSFERFVAGNPRTYSGSIVARYLELLRAAGFRKSATLDAFRYDVQ